jgi:hypothetical protein
VLIVANELARGVGAERVALPVPDRPKKTADSSLDRKCQSKHTIDRFNPQPLASWMRTLFRHDWVVYSKRPLGGPEHVLRCLGAYTIVSPFPTTDWSLLPTAASPSAGETPLTATRRG